MTTPFISPQVCIDRRQKAWETSFLRFQLITQNQFLDDAGDTAGRQPGGGIADGGDHDIEHHLPEQPCLIRHGHRGQNIGGCDTDQYLPGIRQEKRVKENVVERQRFLLQSVTLIFDIGSRAGIQTVPGGFDSNIK